MSSTEIQEWVGTVLRMTMSGTIKWRSLNPTTYAWEIANPQPARAVLQRVERVEQRVQASPPPPRVVQNKVTTYVLQILDKLPANTSITISSDEDVQINALLEKLFTEVATAVKEEDIKILRSLLPVEPETPK
jgi:hypothetical protein